jgi:lysophospholipase L1-like esterase
VDDTRRRRDGNHHHALAFKLITQTIAALAIIGLYHCAEFVLSLVEPPVYRRTNAARPQAREQAKVPPIYEETRAGMRLRRLMDQEIVEPISGRRIRFRTNALGLRGGPVLPKREGVLRIVVLGDSITAGAYVEEDETYPALVEAKLHAAGIECEVINAGMPGAGLFQMLNILSDVGLLLEPVMVVIGLYLNDAAESHYFRPPEGLLADSGLAERLARMRLVSELGDRAEQQWTALTGRAFPARDGNPDAWRTDRAAFEAEMAHAVADWGMAWFGPAWEEMRAGFDALKALSEARGFGVLVTLFPVMHQVEAAFVDRTPQTFFELEMRRVGFAYIDLLPEMRAQAAKGTGDLAYDHCHLNPTGNELAAGEIAAELLRNRGSADDRS